MVDETQAAEEAQKLQAREPTWLPAHVSDATEQRNLLRQSGIVYVAHYETRQPTPVGACFRVYNAGIHAVCITASHVVEHALKLALPYNLHRRIPYGLRASDLEKVCARCFMYCGGLSYGKLPTLASYTIHPETDLAILVFQFSTPFADPAPSVLAIDSDLREPGTPIVSALITNLNVCASAESAETYHVAPRLEFRRGTVTGTIPRGRLVRAAVYETSIPFSPGMSGGPVFLDPGGTSPLRVIGVISHDLSTEEAHATPGIAGYSTVIPIAFVYALSFPGNIDGESGLGIDELCRRQVIVDVGSRCNRIRVERDTDLALRISLP